MAETWNTVRIFISSTFRDMHAERDYLARVVFPELRERCANRRLHVVDLDLRWGVTEEEAEQGKVVEIILDEIDRSRPFFVGLLGERYGSVPDELPEETYAAHPWLGEHPGHSLTALEIIHGVLRKPDTARRSFFYFRDPRFISQVPESKRADFTAESPEAARKLAALKQEIRASGRPVMEDYPCHWDDDLRHLVGLDAFGEGVLEDLWAAICEEYPEEAPEPDPVAVEREMHEAFAEERSHLHVGRAEQARRLTEYVQGTDRRPVVITGESGCGKSAFLANWYRRYTEEHPHDSVLAYFIGASPDSTNHLRLLRNMCQELKRRFGLPQDLPEEDNKLSETLAVLLAAASRDRSRIIVVVDALDQLSPLEAAHGLGWLLDYMPEKARLVVSSLEGDCLDVLRRREAEEITLPALSVSEQRQIAEALLSEWRRRLDERQMAALLAHPAVENPLYLRVALEELRLFGVFERLTARIEALAEDIPGIFDQVLARLEEDHGRGLVAEAFALLGCSRYGLSEAEVLELLAREGEEHLPRALWARLVRGAGAYLVQRGGLLGFFHRQMADAVAARYLAQENKHAKLAAYFERAPIERKLDEYPYQLQQAEQWQALAAALSDLDFFEYAWDHDREYEWIGYWRSLQGRFEPSSWYEAATEAKEKAEGGTEDVTRRLLDIGWFLGDMGLYTSAMFFVERAVTISEQASKYDDLSVALCLNQLAVLHERLGSYAEAARLHRRAMAMRERAVGPNHPSVATSLSNLAAVHEQQGNYGEAIALCQRALAIRDQTLGPDHLDIANSLNNLAMLYYEQGQYAEAVPLYQRALAICERILGPGDPHIAIILNNLAMLYEGQGKSAEALALYRRALATCERVLGPDHPDVATSLNNLAEFHRKEGKHAEALPLCQRALAIRERALSSDHPLLAASINNLALLHFEQGNYAKALTLLGTALGLRERALGPDHPDVAQSLNNLAELHRLQGRHSEALPLYERAVCIAELSLGSAHPQTKLYRRHLSACKEAMREG